MLFALVLLVASPLQAQTGGNCAVIECPGDFMPKPSPPSISGRQNVDKALVAVRDAEKIEEAAERELKTRHEEIKTKLEKPYSWLPRSIVEKLVAAENI